MKKVIKYISLSLIAMMFSCDNDDIKTEIPPFKPLFLSQDFTDVQASSGSTEIPINLNNWKNYNTLNSRKWICKASGDNKFAEFSSFFSGTTTSDESWLVITNQDFTKTTAEALNFRVQTRFSNGATLKLLVSTNYDGTQAGLATANWTEKAITLPTTDSVFVSNNAIDLSTFEGSNISIAFKYNGSKQGGQTTTFQLDDISLFENK